ncbi:cytochrome oxidase small assembly protein [Actimicrobium sp. CCC2.4]|nr:MULTISPECIES: cytochrome oxidase small assembly protein [unclassified Actimicrobium]MDY7576301.1 cytochrome oxidase small assembly protein [Actimicrobium sp. CCI2.3]MEB0020495.1 cytochrome oxidase small assembly protein [Actimicrobium sp. CCI2.3]MEB0134259.1 cytochrome oxidase small assembly protein [Actimicrobium sp. CCC2.4]WPX32907.1 cytochrome oxidase small assembly protein [Actimicrobium sp. CCC2.4]
MATPNKPSNLRTALVLASIAVMFFAGVVVKHVWFG